MAQNQMLNLGVDNFGWAPAFTDYKQILEQLKTGDDMLIYEGMINLSNQLSMAQENTLTTFPLDQYVPVFMDILKKPPLSDLSNESNMFVINCLTNLMDIFPSVWNTIVNHGAIKCIAEVLERSMGYIDLNEACIKCLEKISIENPYGILTSGTIGLCLNMMDFFEIATQKRILSMIVNISRHSASEQDLNDHVLPIMPFLSMLLQSRGDHAQGKIETVCNIVLGICQSIPRFLSPHSQFDKVQQQYENIGQTGIIDSILQRLQDYCVFDVQEQMEQSIITQTKTKSLSNQAVEHILKILTLCCKYSINLTKMIVSIDIFRLIEQFIPSAEDLKNIHFNADKFPFIIDTLNLIDSLLPEREESLQNEHDKPRLILEQAKKEFYLAHEQPKVLFIAEKILPKVFSVYENNIQTTLRNRSLRVIDKMILLFNDELLNNFIEPYSFAKFIYSNLRSNNLSSIQICLQMIDKLMRTNPQTYTLPLMREGVTTYIKKIASKEAIEKTLGVSLDEVDKQTAADPLADAKDREEFLAKARQVILQRSLESQETQEQQQQFESTIQRYLDAARKSSQQQPDKVKIELAKNVVGLAEPLMSKFFENVEFQSKLNEWYGEEFKMINMLKNLSKDIIEEAKSEEFNFDRIKSLMKQLAEILTNKRQVMSYEFKESGLLHALDLLLTNSPQQISLLLEKDKLQGEEVKHSEEMMMSQMTKNSQSVSKKEARAFMQRLKVFTHYMLNNNNDKKPLNELISLCHELLSQSEYLLFESPTDSISNPYGGMFSHPYGGGGDDPNQSVHALRQLTKRTRVNLIYDPKKSFIQKSTPKKKEQEDSGLLESPSLSAQRSNSHHPAFLQLGGGRRLSQEEHHSKVFVKRNFLYSELEQVLISVEQCASLHLLEDFLRNKIRTVDDVKQLKTPSSYYSSSLSKKQPSSLSDAAKVIIDKALSRVREMMDNNFSKDQLKLEVDDFANTISDDLVNAATLSDLQQTEVLRHLENLVLHMIDEIYAEQEAQYDEQMRDDLLEGGGDGSKDEEMQQFEQKVYEYQRMISQLRALYRTKKQARKDSSGPSSLVLEKHKVTDKVMKDDTKQEEQSTLIDTQMKSNDDQVNKAIAAAWIEEMKDEDNDDDEEEKKETEELIKREETSHHIADVEMTDEEAEEEQRKMIEHLHRARQNYEKGVQQREIELSVEGQHEDKDNNQEPSDATELKETLQTDLDELIKATGDDIEFEFYFKGILINNNQTIYEIFKQAENRQSFQEQQILGINAPGLGGYGFSKESQNIYFVIKDKKDELQLSRKDSLLEFSQKRERTKSEAVNDISVSAVNSIVQQLIEKEFKVFNQETIVKYNSAEKQQEMKQLESALKILKVMNFVCKNIQLFSNQGIRFIINSNDLFEEQKDDTFTDLSLQIGISQLNSNVFHHHKLDSYILKNIQDPYALIGGGISETLQQIFKNCPFLFPFQTRQLFFKLISFIGSIDMNRSIYFLRQFLKQKLGKLPAEDKNNAVKFQKQKVIVDRNRIIDSAFSLVKQINKRAFLEVQYKDEVGTGLGPTLEFYCLISNEIKNVELMLNGVKQSIWRKNMQDNSLYPAPISVHNMKHEELQKLYEIFRLIGIMLAKSISDDRLIDLPVSSLLWDLVLGKKMSIFDLERIDKDLFKIFAELQQLANQKKVLDKQVFMDQESKIRQMNTLRTSQGARVEDLGFVFTLPGYENIELKQNGRQTDVTLDNVQEYIDLVMHYQFHESIKIQLQAFKKGFNSIFPLDTLKPFSTHQELEDMICGVQRNEADWINVQNLSQNVVPAHGYHSKSHEYLDLLKFMSQLDHEKRRKFLKFVTGSPRLPNGGFSALDPKLTVVLKKPINPKESPDDILPSVMTCQNYIKLPSYSSFDKLVERFEFAFNEGTNNFTLS